MPTCLPLLICKKTLYINTGKLSSIKLIFTLAQGLQLKIALTSDFYLANPKNAYKQDVFTKKPLQIEFRS